jgi:Polysaccharide lyase
MNKSCPTVLAIGIAVAVATARSSQGAIVSATSLSSFEGIEEPTVIYHPSTATFTADSYANIVDEGAGMFRYTLRYQPNLDYWDGDRATTNTDRQRAEVKGLGPHQETNQTFEYSFDWRTDSNFIGTTSFCHIFQLKATNGDDSPPLVTLSLSTNNTGRLQLWSGTAANSTVARTFSYADNVWEHADIIIHAATDNTGFVEASLNGDPFKGLFNLPVYRPDATDYRPKWGFYRGINSNLFVGTNYVEDRNVTAQALSVPEPASAVLLAIGAASLLGLLRRRTRA